MLVMPGCTVSLDLLAMALPLCTGKPQINIVWKKHLAHCHYRTDVLQGVLTAPLRSNHCTSKAQSLKGQSCSKLMFKILHGLYISQTFPVCWLLSVSVELVREWNIWLTKITAEMVYFTNRVLQRKILKKNVVWMSVLKLPLPHEFWLYLSCIPLLPFLALDSFALWWSMERDEFWSFVY